MMGFILGGSIMKISDLIEKLQDAKLEHGDIECIIKDEGHYSWGNTDILSDFKKCKSPDYLNVFSINDGCVNVSPDRKIDAEDCLIIGVTHAVP